MLLHVGRIIIIAALRRCGLEVGLRQNLCGNRSASVCPDWPAKVALQQQHLTSALKFEMSGLSHVMLGILKLSSSLNYFAHSSSKCLKLGVPK